MYHINKDTTIAGISELRTRSADILNFAKKNNVILQKHSEPVAVIMDYQRYLQFEQLLDLAEDYILGTTAHERDINSKPGDFIDINDW